MRKQCIFFWNQSEISVNTAAIKFTKHNRTLIKLSFKLCSFLTAKEEIQEMMTKQSKTGYNHIYVIIRETKTEKEKNTQTKRLKSIFK